MYWLQDPLFVFERAFHLLLQSMNKIEERFKFLFKLKSWSTTNFDSSFTLSWMFFSNWDWFVQKINAIQEQKLPVLSFRSIFSYCQSTSLPMQMIKNYGDQILSSTSIPIHLHVNLSYQVISYSIFCLPFWVSFK